MCRGGRDKDAKTLLQVAENVKNLYFKMSSSVTSFCRPNHHIHFKRCCALKHPREGVQHPTPSGRGLIIHDFLRAARASNAK